ncbi:MAG: dihydrofolate reductase family protein [Rubrivivax sp.]|nr:dihydrofolate reductase family protein [Rubrivivax sp.]
MTRAQAQVFIATSLDGFIARPDGSLDWLLQAQATAPAGEDFGYAAFMAGIDALVMGRKTFETVLAFDPWPFPDHPVHVMSRSDAVTVPEALGHGVSMTRLAPADLLQQLPHTGVQCVYLDGGELIQAFLAADLVDRMTLTTVPVLLGSGRRLFGPLPADRVWTIDGVRHWDNGFVQARYSRARFDKVVA